MINIKLINCPAYTHNRYSIKVDTSFLPPLGLASITSYLRSKGIKVSQDDLNIKVHYDNFYTENKLDLQILLDENRIKDYLKGRSDRELEKFTDGLLNKTDFNGVNFVGLSVYATGDTSSFMSCSLLSKHVKQRYKIPIVIGGPMSTSVINYFVEEFKFLNNLGFVDYCIKGGGEIPLYELIKCLNNNRDLNQIKGLVYAKNGIIINNGWGKFIVNIKPDFKGLPLQLYICNVDDGFKDRVYLGNEQKKSLILPIKFIRNCPHHCIFCGSSLENNLLILEPKQVVNYLKDLSKEYNTKFFYFLIDTINISNQYIDNLCDELIKSDIGILWSANAHLGNLNKELVQKMRDAGCIRLIFGFETGAPRLSKYIRKGLGLSEISNTLKLCNEANIWVGVEIITGLPTEQEIDIDMTIDFLKKNNKYLDSIYVNPFYLAEGSLLKAFSGKYGITNIKEIRQFQETDSESYNHSPHIFSFDEINGLVWEKKKKQISHSFERVANSILSPPKKFSLTCDQESILFYLYANYKEKNKIKNIYYAYIKYLFKKLKADYPNSIITRPLSGKIKKLIWLAKEFTKAKSKIAFLKEILSRLYFSFIVR